MDPGTCPALHPPPPRRVQPVENQRGREGAATRMRCQWRANKRYKKERIQRGARKKMKGEMQRGAGGGGYSRAFARARSRGGMPQTFPNMRSHILNPLQGGATGEIPLALARGSPLGTFSVIRTGRSLIPRLRGVLLAGLLGLLTGPLAGFLTCHACRARGGRPLSTFTRDGGGLCAVRR